MTSAAPALTESSALSARSSRVAEFLLVGGATLVLFPALWLLRNVVGLERAELGVGFTMFYAAHLINDPHFAVTYLLFYRDARRRAFGEAFEPWQRVRYVVAGGVAPCVLLAWLVVALGSRSAAALGTLIELMFVLVGWHYVKQGFGVLSVLSARRGVRFSQLERRVILAHCFAGWGYAWASPAQSRLESEEKGVLYFSLPHPPWLERLTFAAFALSALALGAVLLSKWHRERRLPPLAPLTGLLVSIWAWSVYSSADPLLVYMIPALHSLQYLYFVWLLKRNQARDEASALEFGSPAVARLWWLAAGAVALGWLLFHAAPELFDAIRISEHRRSHERLGDLGPTPWFAAIFAFVNIHHYFMDNVLWRRENPDTRYLRR